MDLLDISFGATSISSPPPPGSNDAWNGLGASALGANNFAPSPAALVAANTATQQADPWSSSRQTASPALADPWVPSLHKPATSASPALRMDTWNNTRTQSPSITSNSSVENWDAGAGVRATTNGNTTTTTSADPWLAKTGGADPWIPPKPADPWSSAAGEMSKEYGVRRVFKSTVMHAWLQRRN